jgi:choline dehydrogenase
MKYDSAPQEGLKNRCMKMISGKLLGGTTRVNNGLYSRCSAMEFENWGEGWEYPGLEKLYDRAERKVERSGSKTEGGEWSTRIVPPFFKSSQMYTPHLRSCFLWCWADDRFLESVKEMGVPFVEDINTANQPIPCITKLRTTVTADGKRSSAYEAFLSQSFIHRHSKNLKICLGVVVQKIQISLLAGQKVAEGVFVEDEKTRGSTDRYYIRGKEIILSAGAVASPQLLILRYYILAPCI